MKTHLVARSTREGKGNVEDEGRRGRIDVSFEVKLSSFRTTQKTHLSSEISRDLSILSPHSGQGSHSDSVDRFVSKLDGLEKSRGGRGSGGHGEGEFEVWR